MGKRVAIHRPWVFGGLIGLLGLVLALTGQTLWGAHQRADMRPTTLVTAAALIEPTLQEAAWISLSPTPDAPTLWVVVQAECAPCQQLLAGPLQRAERRGVDLRLVLVGRPDSPLAPLVAAVARDRSASLYTAWRQGGFGPDFADAPAPPTSSDAAAEIEGFVELGQAVAERLGVIATRNEVALGPIALFWRMGPEWRCAPDADGAAVALALRELTSRGAPTSKPGAAT